ncbi:hypothetical protein [Massilia sp. DWR3-1-1]|uniref:hypothetical protein n=1 Tax=Massilia sp. DWR3-1-1 TaxID=2804559 RepID=UPI003CEAE9E2
MKHKSPWKNNGNELNPHYDFIEEKIWNLERLNAEIASIEKKIQSSIANKNPTSQEKWLEIFNLLPLGLKKIVLLEMKNGNQIISIAKPGWPDHQSVVVKLKNRFHINSRITLPFIKWRLLNDPHYCMEEISHSKDGVVNLIIV